MALAAAVLAWLLVGPGSEGCRDDQVQVGGGPGAGDAPG
jgi:hypothetical protein